MAAQNYPIPLLTRLFSTKTFTGWAIFSLSLLGLVLIYIRIRYLGVPFERDEGEYAYGAQILLQGKNLYSHVYSLKWPGIFLIYTLIIGVLGASVEAVHLGSLIADLATAVIIFRILFQWGHWVPAALASLVYMVMMTQKELQGIFANIEHFVVFFIALAVAQLLVSWKKGRPYQLVYCGLFCGLALITKQQAIGFIGAIGVAILSKHYIEKETLQNFIGQVMLFTSGVLLPLLVTFLWIFFFDDFERFWFHTITYATEYIGITSLEAGWFELSKRIKENLAINPGLWFCFIMSLLWLPFSKVERTVKVFLGVLFLGAFAAMSFGLYYRPHYVMFMPLSAALLIGVMLNKLYQVRLWLPTLLVLASVIYYGLKDRDYLFNWTPEKAVSTIYHWETFAATVAVGEYLREDAANEDKILVVGSEPQINFYARKDTPTGYVYSYPLVEDQAFAKSMFEEWKAEMEEGQPKYVVAMGEWITYAKKSEGFYALWDASQEYLERYGYSLIGIVEIEQDKTFKENWGENLSMPENKDGWLFIYRKNQ